MMQIRKALNTELSTVLAIHEKAFQREEIVDLVKELLDDPTAAPLLSLLALEEEAAIGHILFSAAQLEGDPHKPVCALLAPLAVLPEKQCLGVGGMLIRAGLEQLKAAGVDLVFVLGHPGYYPKYGFQPAGVLGFEAPYPIPEKDAGAWMVQALRPGILEEAQGVVRPAQAIDQPQHWRE